ncbi:MAG: triose-phosphate isomerase [Alphaproteobacteria bacterium]|nr:triose-phosphate isomerase [Alphaproteobacteria bacterium]
MPSLIIANWKQYIRTEKEIETFFNELHPVDTSHLVVCPPYTHMDVVAMYKKKHSNIFLGAQDVSDYIQGAHTGSVSIESIKDREAEYVIIGHSETRDLGVTEEQMALRIQLVLQEGLIPIVCVEGEGDEYSLIGIQRQIQLLLKNIREKELKKIIIAYEPKGRIGSNDALDTHSICRVALLIKDTVRAMSETKTFTKIPVLYGGAVDEHNVGHLFSETGVEGFLIGRASASGSRMNAILSSVS